MVKESMKEVLQNEINRIDEAHIAKRKEVVIEGFQDEEGYAPKAVVTGKPYAIFNSNDYLGLRFHPDVRKGEEEASHVYGAGPGAVRFISGSLKVHRDLEKALAKFHGREDAMVFSSAFATNLAVIPCFLKGQSRDSLVTKDALVVSDALNHRSIIDGVRVAGLGKENKAIFQHMDIDDLKRVLEENKGKFKRVVVVTDGVFSMLGEYQDIGKLQEAVEEYQDQYEEGIITIVDDAHGVGSFGATGRGTEEVSSGTCDILVGTLGKGLGADGGYIVADQVVIDYLRESAATYIYSNSISPGTAGAGLASVKLMMSEEGTKLLASLNENIAYFKEKMKSAGFVFAADSVHGIQPVLIGDAGKSRALTDELLARGFVVTNISFPVVPKGKDEIRVQMSAAHTRKDLDEFIEAITVASKKVGVLG